MDPIRSLLVGRGAVFERYLARLRQVAASDATVLLGGESGSGKDLSARALHAASGRAAGPLVCVSLAALAPTLVESELFGHVEGAFTGARGPRQGRMRQAHGGTLVLDDVDSLPPAEQGKLVRVLQTRVVEPVGAEQGEPIDARVVCTTRTDLRAAVEAGRFRQDLYFRLAVLQLEVPPLRARVEDLPELCAHLIARLARERGARPRALSPQALERLAQHPWPGNVRELENALERALVLAPAGDPEAPVGSQELDFLQGAVAGAAAELAASALSHGVRLAELERALLERALAEHRGNLSAAARAVGLSRRAFESRLGRPRARRRGGADAAAEPGSVEP